MGPLDERLCLSIPLNSFALILEQVERKKTERERRERKGERGSQESFNVKEDERETAEEKGNKI